MANNRQFHAVENGLRVIYYVVGQSVHRYEETAELDEDGLAVFQYTGSEKKSPEKG